ncbi:hypothetical protein Geob_2845 [Geotalea daltonii FRC-32]|uniref:Uncharacterized protein n=1 Tax=Geotalea daltonii (strain DSM 22248 / JCM 15807 / FRC-32) TaxID=316067 RepID=B9M272_GEODF|nr:MULTISPECIES: hypothetical protein [Geotalea]ACM21190.1 hypothetical protein Geob_2845 [Geotalea daltonii FRC-32]
MARMVNVIFIDGAIEPVPPSLLKELISLREIRAFERTEGWVYIGQAPIRRKLKPIKGPGQRSYDIYLE